MRIRKYSFTTRLLLIATLLALAFKGVPQIKRHDLVISRGAELSDAVKQLAVQTPTILPTPSPAPILIVFPFRVPSLPLFSRPLFQSPLCGRSPPFFI